MSIYVWSALADGALLAFNPSADALNFDDSGISAASIGLNAMNSTQSVFVHGGKTVTLQTAPTTLTATNVTFAGGGRLLVGDGTTGTAKDDVNNIVDGGVVGDQLYGLAGNDTLRGHGGADMLAGGAGNDTLIGGAGIDTAVFSGKFANYSLAGSTAGSLTVTDANGAVSGGDGTDALIGIERLQFLDASVELRYSSAGEFKIDATVTDDQYQPSTRALADGGFVMTWQADLQDGSGWGIYGQRYNAAGAMAGSEFKVNGTVTSDQYQPSVIALTNGFLVAWTSDGQDGSGLGIYGQRYDAAGGTAGGAFKINKTVTNDQYQPSVAALADGGFVVTWQSYLQDGSGWGIYGQRYDMAGAIAGGEFRINTTVAGDQIRPSVTSLAGGDFVVTWESLDGAGSGTTLCAQRYDPAGAKVGGEVAVDTSVAHSGSSPLVTALAEGGFVVTWQSYLQDGTGRDIYGQLHNAAGATIGSGFKINTTTADSDEQPWPCVTALADGGFEVTWCSNAQDGSGLDIYGQRYDAAGARAGGEVRINATSADSQEQPSVTALVDGGLVVTWMTYLEGSSERGIYGQRYGADGGKIGLEMSLAITGNASDQSFTGTPGDDSLDGGGGADTLSGGGGYDTLNGGAGFDTAIFSGAVGSYHFAENGAQVIVTGPDGTDTLTNIEQLNFANLAFSIADRSHFDPLYYLEHNRDVAAAAIDPLTHYRNAGWAEGRDPNPNCAPSLGERARVHRFLQRPDGGVWAKQGRGLSALRHPGAL